MPWSATLTGSLERELAWARLALEELIATLALPDVEVAALARTRARARFARFTLPAAVIASDGIRIANEAWRVIVGATLPSWAEPSLDLVRRTGVPVVLDGVPSADRASALTATLSRAHADDQHAVLAVCAQMTEAVIAGEVQVPAEALVWSGAVATGSFADYRNDRAATADHTEDGRWKRAFADALRQRGPVDLELDLRLADGVTVPHRAAILVTPSRARWFTVAVPSSSAQLAREERDRLLLQIRTTQREAEAARRVQDLVLAAVSHELRAPVTTTMLWLRVLCDPRADHAQRLQAIDAIQQSAAAQSRIVGDLLDVARASSGKLHVDLRPVSVDTLVRSAVEAAGPAALAKRIDLIHDADAFVGEVQGDSARLRQVLDNLLVNAIKFTPAGGQVRVRVRRKRLAVVIEVEDTGCGIEPDALEVIFEPFRQLEGQLSAADGGLGLGLAIALQIVELHHGTIEAMSEGRGHGTRMTVTLPAPGHRRAASPATDIAAPRTLDDVRVLVVDDDTRVRDALTHLLGRVGARVIPAESAAVARERLISDSPQVLVCDIAMPDEDGNAFIRSLRATGNNVPAIALTGYASRADAATAVSSGFNLHIAKPIDFELLVARMTQLLTSQIT